MQIVVVLVECLKQNLKNYVLNSPCKHVFKEHLLDVFSLWKNILK